MSYILNIHTATDTAIVNIGNGEEKIATVVNTISRQHAAFLHTAIQSIMKENGVSITELSAVGVTSGPGSYTGIRVGMAAAKGLCYALKVPLITLNTLEILALSAIESTGDAHDLYCPMIDARRMEVYTAIYNYDLKEIVAPSAINLTDTIFGNQLQSQKVYFFGDGSGKYETMANTVPRSYFIKQDISSAALYRICLRKFQKKEWADVGSAAPLYLKEFYSPKEK